MQTEPQLSPQAAYDQAARPLDIVRRPVENWSDVEQAALSVATANAKGACAARNPFQYKGEDLLAYARLCAFAQMWEPVQQAATSYLIEQITATPAEKLTGFPNLSMAFDYEVQASLHLKNTANAFGTVQTMLRTVPYDDLASDAVNSTVRYVQLIATDQALTLLHQRQPLLLALLKANGAKVAVSTTSPPTDILPAPSRPPLSIHELYADAIELPAMLQFAKKPDEAAMALAELEAAVPQSLAPDDAILTAASRQQYKLLGAPLPEIGASASLLDLASPKPPDINGKSAGAAVFLLFPDWCAQCVAMESLFSDAATRLKGDGVHFYALLAQANPEPPAPKQIVKPAVKGAGGGSRVAAPIKRASDKGVAHVEIEVGVKAGIAEQLVGTPTLIVPNRTVDTFVATDFPLLIVTDGHGIVRYIGIAPNNALVEGGLIYQVAERVLEQWPVAVISSIKTR